MQAFSAWVAKTQLQQAVRRFAAILRNRVQLSAFNTWRAAVHEGRQMEQDLHQVRPRTRAARAPGDVGREGRQLGLKRAVCVCGTRPQDISDSFRLPIYYKAQKIQSSGIG